MMSDTYAVILAGGSGTRFWPQSRHLRPKQLCVVGGGEHTMIETTLMRLDGLIPKERRIVITHQDQIEQTKDIVKEHCHLVIGEPRACNTAAALALGAQLVANLGGSSMISLHSDHVIETRDAFQESAKNALKLAELGYLTLIGIPPTRPDTGYGYIEQGNSLSEGFKVASFREKPEQHIAESYLEKGHFLWNSGIFTWSINTFQEELKKYLPNTYETFSKLQGVNPETLAASDLGPLYEQLQTVGVDNAILEVSSKVAVIRATFQWHDIGSWNSLNDCFACDDKGNLIWADSFSKDTKNCTIDARDRFVATIGVEDLCIVSSPDALLVCKKERAQEVKEVVAWLKDQGRNQLV
ncbi:MAG: mannose-1-phosphate guanylyltransferase [Oligoflexales bacterium]